MTTDMRTGKTEWSDVLPGGGLANLDEDQDQKILLICSTVTM
jgi:hypothetical protein